MQKGRLAHFISVWREGNSERDVYWKEKRMTQKGIASEPSFEKQHSKVKKFQENSVNHVFLLHNSWTTTCICVNFLTALLPKCQTVTRIGLQPVGTRDMWSLPNRKRSRWILREDWEIRLWLPRNVACDTGSLKSRWCRKEQEQYDRH